MSPRISVVPSEPTHPQPPASASRAKPLLASEVLREQAAPLEPGRHAMRAWLLGTAVLFAGLGLAFGRGFGVPGLAAEASLIAYAAAGALAALAALPFPYAVRAGLAVLISVSTMALGLRGAGPLAGLEADGGVLRDATRLIGATALPAALMFRAHYTEYHRSRVLLLVGFGLAIPFALAELTTVVDTSGALLVRSWAVLDVLLILASLLALTGPAGGAGSNVLGALLLAFVPGQLGIRAFTPLSGPDSGAWTYPLTAVAFLAATVPASLGLCQLLAAAFAPEARAESVRGRSPAPAAKPPGPGA